MQRHSVYFGLNGTSVIKTGYPVLEEEEPAVPVIIITTDDSVVVTQRAMLFAKKLRRVGVPCMVDYRPGKFGKKLERAAKMRVYYVAIFGPDECANGDVTLKDMDEKTQETIPEAGALAKLAYEVITPEEQKAAHARHEFEQQVHNR